jgi:hypothetical protein
MLKETTQKLTYKKILCFPIYLNYTRAELFHTVVSKWFDTFQGLLHNFQHNTLNFLSHNDKQLNDVKFLKASPPVGYLCVCVCVFSGHILIFSFSA